MKMPMSCCASAAAAACSSCETGVSLGDTGVKVPRTCAAGVRVRVRVRVG